MTQILVAILLSVGLDRFIPDRFGFSPFTWYREWAESIEQRFNGGKQLHGVGAVLLATLPILLGIVLVRFVLGELGWVLRFAFDVFVLYMCLDVYRLSRVAGSVAETLETGDVQEADQLLRELNVKGASELTESGVARTTVETVLKQGNSAVISPLFWFILLGPAGAVLQRLTCILDTMWGHRDDRFVGFGWAAARFDDLLEWIPARITAISYAIMGSFEDALHSWRRRVGVWSDINSGPLLASGFGAMHMEECEISPEEGDYDEKPTEFCAVADATDVQRVVALVWRVLLFWLGVGILMAGAHLAGFIAG